MQIIKNNILNILNIPLRHIQVKCDKNGYCYPECYACALSWCSVCLGFEGDLTTHCLGRKMLHMESEMVYKAGFDYRSGEWIRRKTYKHNDRVLYEWASPKF